MRRLIYTSSSPKLLDGKALEQILAVSRRNNLRDDITGLLVYHEGNFFQVLEGPDEHVEACYQRILGDTRHAGHVNLISEQIAFPIFENWRMAFQRYDSLDDQQQKQFVDIQALARRRDVNELENSPMVMALTMAFLSNFRELDVVV